MTAMRLMCDVIGDSIRTGDVARATEVLGRLEQVASAAADDLRQTVARLYPVVMEQQGLIQALGSLAETVQEEYGVNATFTRPSTAWEPDNERDTAIFQIAREAAINAARYGRPPSQSASSAGTGASRWRSRTPAGSCRPPPAAASASG